MEGQNRPVYRILRTRTIVLGGIGLVVVGIVAAVWLLLAYGQGTESDRNQLEAIKTAGTIVVGTGGAGALWLAARRQRSSEIALRQKDFDQDHLQRVAAASEADAAERRVIDAYTKASDQLGSDKAPVRLAGMYALERLAQNTPGQRQTIVNVLCAYLRMPYTPDPESEQAVQERQVRLTAQHILAAHLQHGAMNVRTRVAGDTFWPDIELDLTGATLLDFDLSYAELLSATFKDAVFLGNAQFEATRFIAETVFSGARFAAGAGFHRAYFGFVHFDDVVFQDVRFTEVELLAGAGFDWALFRGGTEFSYEISQIKGLSDTRGISMEGALVRTDAEPLPPRTWPPGFTEAPESGPMDGLEGSWARIIRE